MHRFDLKGRVATVTGGDGGIGFGIARALASAGASIVVAGSNNAKNAAAVREIETLGATALAVHVDVSLDASCKSMVKHVVNHFGRLDILVNNADGIIPKQSHDLKDWYALLHQNLTSAFSCSEAAYHEMCKIGGGKIINVGPIMGNFALPISCASDASESGLVQMARAMAVAWAKDNIQVNTILPGWTDTDATRAACAQIEGLNERVLAGTPLGRWADIDDFAGIAVFLASAASQFVTGTAIPVDGGYSIQV